MNKLFTLAVTLLVALTGAAQEKPQQAAVQEEPFRINHGPYLQNPETDGVTVTWITNRPSVGWVEIAPIDGDHFYRYERPKIFDAVNGTKRTSTHHEVKLEGLEPGKRYYYRVYATEVLSHSGNRMYYGNTAALDVYTKLPPEFKTLEVQPDTLTFSIFNDIHARKDVFANLAEKCDITKNDFAFFNGDMVSIFNSERQVFDGIMDTVVTLFAKSTPIIYLRGNHETRGEIATSFQDYFCAGDNHLYGIRRIGPLCIVMLDTGEDKPDSDIEYYGANVFDEYRRSQAAWLEQALQSEEYRTAAYKVVIAHMPPLGLSWYGPHQVRDLFVPLLNEAHPDIMICGHVHKYLNYEPGSIVNFPVVTNSNNSVLKMTVTAEKLEAKMISTDGSILTTFELMPKQ